MPDGIQCSYSSFEYSISRYPPIV